MLFCHINITYISNLQNTLYYIYGEFRQNLTKNFSGTRGKHTAHRWTDERFFQIPHHLHPNINSVHTIPLAAKHISPSPWQYPPCGHKAVRRSCFRPGPCTTYPTVPSPAISTRIASLS